MKKGSILTAALLFMFSTLNATVWYVHSDSSLNSIQAGLDSCADNDTVLVGPGIYYEYIIWPTTQGIDLVSEYGPDTTIIDGYNTDSMSVITIYNQVDFPTIIRGFTIRNGYGDVAGGIDCVNSSLTIADNIITNNTGFGAVMFGSGGGICCFDTLPLIITGNTITNNNGVGGGGIQCWGSSSAIITGNIIADNTGWDQGGGIYCWSSSSVTISGNTITGNSAGLPPDWAGLGGGIACLDVSSATITDNTITGNTAFYGHGGGISCIQSSPIIDSCTISNNDSGGVFCWVGSNPIIHYSNIAENTGYGVYNDDSAVVIDARYNWWGHASGPGGVGPGTGDEVSEYVDYDPWLGQPIGAEEGQITRPTKTSEFETTIFTGPLLLPEGRKCRVFDITGRVVKPAEVTRGIYFMEVDGKVVQKAIKIR